MNAPLIAGRYRIERRLGIGGMSTVHQALDARLERQVAIKLLAEHLAEDPNFVTRFRREALAAARLVHPNIVQVFDFGLDEPTGQHYIVMELVDGPSCAELLRDQGTLPVDETIDIIDQACNGLDHAHRNGVVHRDVKPGNLLRTGDSAIKLADFGIARATDQSSITQVGSVLGTAAYLAPEQARGEEAGPEADVYALGVVTYQLLSGRLPYEATSLSELALKQQREVPLPLETANPQVPPTLSRAVARALAIDVAERYPDALTMGQTLRAGARGIEPPELEFESPATEATRMMTSRQRGEGTAATRMMPPRDRTRVGPPPRATAARQRRAEPPDRSRRGFSWRAFFTTMLILAILVAVVAILSIGQTGGEPSWDPVTAQDPVEAIDQVRDNIRRNRR